MEYNRATQTTIPHLKYVEIMVKNVQYPSIVVDEHMGLKYHTKLQDIEGVTTDYIFQVKDWVKLSLAKLKYEF